MKIGTQATITDKEQIRDYLSDGNLIVDRGYTSHEHFAEVGLIHMNGRLYDPLLRRFLNADENIQDPHNTQNYNKYGYVLNNPLMYNDPSGEFFLAIPVLTAIIIGAAVGLASYVITGLITGQDISLLGAFKATLFGAVSGAVTFGIGCHFKVAMEGLQIANSVVKAAAQAGLALAQAAAHGVAQGALSLMQGGNATMGAISGAFGSLGASAFGAGMKQIGLETFAKSGAGTVLSGIILGGVGSELVGGNFWQGAVIGGIVSGLNHAMHSMGNNMEVLDDGDGGDCPTCPKNAKEGQTYTIPNGNDPLHDTYVYKNGEWVDRFWANAQMGTVDIGPASGAKYLLKMMKNPNFVESSVKQVGEFWEYTAKIAGRDGSFTKYYRYFNSEGKTLKFFHDTYNIVINFYTESL